ncbi:MAG: 2Fe-2S iron-sulfur cluster binding domain-containing protein [Alteromonadaceae bacterium]|nr:2Fe-2S iron-sulfur cluster binding domain-containing protein [Alteromonadaceae bacterium]
MKNAISPVFHEGERAIQSRLGIEKRMEKVGDKVIRDYMPAQHQAFYAQLPMLFAGFTDNQEDVWASVLAGQPGFINAPSATQLSIQATPFNGDPLATALAEHRATQPMPIGLLGIELHTRRRNRVSTQVNSINNGYLLLDVLQTTGNCPQYIQRRELHAYSPESIQQPVSAFSQFDNALSKFIQRADTFFVASTAQKPGQEPTTKAHGADVSHRGGRSGFVRVDDARTLTIPDYMGNNFFNTLGNFMLNPAAGLLFIDFESGDIVTMTGTANILWDDNQHHFKGAERLWQFTLKHGYVLKAAMPYRFRLQDYSPNSLMTGTWHEAASHATQHTTIAQWQNYSVTGTFTESTSGKSSAIKSLHLTSPTGEVPNFKPGQFISVKLTVAGTEHVRAYSISSSPLDNVLRISVKREGVVSNWLHDHIVAGDILQVKLTQSDFYLSENSQKPVVLLSAGVGITPMVSMFRYIVQNNFRTRSQQKVIMINTFRTRTEQAFRHEIRQLSNAQSTQAQAIWLLTAPSETCRPGIDYSTQGRLTKDILQTLLPFDNCDFYLCGPTQFMQDTYDLLQNLGVHDSAIFAESFGPAALQRSKPANADAVSEDAATSALITFSRSRIEQTWTPQDGHLLDFAENHGLSPEYGCRAGSCGACKVRITHGKVLHSTAASTPPGADEALLCCARPAKTANDDTPRITIDL